MAEITHRQLEIFRTIMISGSVSEAARLLFSSQPTLSRELARLEQLLGYDLFERQRGRLIATARARLLFDEVQRSFISLSRIADMAGNLRQEAAGELSIVCLPAIAHALLPAVCRRLVADFPSLHVSITPQEPPLLDEWLSFQRFDLGLTEHTEAPPGTRLTLLPTLQEVCVLPAGHVLLEKKAISLQDLAGESFVSLSPDDPYRLVIDRLCAEAGIKRKMQWETHSAVSVCEMVKEGLGAAIVNPLTAWAMADERLHIRSLVVAIPYQLAVVLPEFRPAVDIVPDFIRQAGLYIEDISRRACA